MVSFVLILLLVVLILYLFIQWFFTQKEGLGTNNRLPQYFTPFTLNNIPLKMTYWSNRLNGDSTTGNIDPYTVANDLKTTSRTMNIVLYGDENGINPKLVGMMSSLPFTINYLPMKFLLWSNRLNGDSTSGTTDPQTIAHELQYCSFLLNQALNGGHSETTYSKYVSETTQMPTTITANTVTGNTFVMPMPTTITPNTVTGNTFVMPMPTTITPNTVTGNAFVMPMPTTITPNMVTGNTFVMPMPTTITPNEYDMTTQMPTERIEEETTPSMMMDTTPQIPSINQYETTIQSDIPYETDDSIPIPVTQYRRNRLKKENNEPTTTEYDNADEVDESTERQVTSYKQNKNNEGFEGMSWVNRSYNNKTSYTYDSNPFSKNTSLSFTNMYQ